MYLLIEIAPNLMHFWLPNICPLVSAVHRLLNFGSLCRPSASILSYKVNWKAINIEENFSHDSNEFWSLSNSYAEVK